MPGRNTRLLVAAYVGLLIWLAQRLPFWLDEVLQLIGTSRPTWGGAFGWVVENPGAAPLGYLVQHAFVSVMGITRLSARMAPAIFSVLAALALAGLARDLGFRRQTATLVVFFVLPIQLRYAVEGRPYSQAMFFAVAATWCLWRISVNPSWRLAIAYALLVAAGLYSQTFAGFVQFGAIAALALAGRRRELIPACVGLAAGYALFVPWYLYSRAAWQHEVIANSFAFVAGAKFILMPIREISGGGYAVSIPLLIASALGVRGGERAPRWFLLGSILSGAGLAIAADAWFGYFFAVRQILFIVPALVLLAVEGVSALPSRDGKGAVLAKSCAFALAAVFLLGSLAKDWTYFRKSNEDWEAAAAALLQNIGPETCVMMCPHDDPRLYTLFKPSLSERFCAGHPEAAVIVAVNPYTWTAELRKLQDSLQAGGYTRDRELQRGGTRMLFYRRQ